MPRNGGTCRLPLRKSERLGIWIEVGVGVDEGDFLRGGGGGKEMLFLGGAVPETGAEDLDGVAVEGPSSLVAALELKGAGGNAYHIAVEVDHGAVGEGVDFDGAVAELGFPGAFAGLEVDGAAGCGAAAQEQGEGKKQKRGFHF